MVQHFKIYRLKDQFPLPVSAASSDPHHARIMTTLHKSLQYAEIRRSFLHVLHGGVSGE